MSIKLMSQVYEYQFTHAEQAIVLCMADHAHDDGTKCFPGIDRMAWKTTYEERQIKRVLKALVARGVLEVVAFATGGRGHPTEYTIHLENAERKPDFVPCRKGDTSRTSPSERVTSDARSRTQRVTFRAAQQVTMPVLKRRRATLTVS